MTRTERTYYLLTCVWRIAWSALGPTYGLFLLDRGLDLLQLNLVLAIYLITICVFEVPTGAIADVFGRKASFLLSCLVRAAAFGLYYFSNSFSEFVVAEVIDAIGTTLATGAFDAWAVDGVRAEGDHRARRPPVRARPDARPGDGDPRRPGRRPGGESRHRPAVADRLRRASCSASCSAPC